jgi:hypothetical protein
MTERSCFVEVSLGARLRAYAVILVLIAFSVPFLHRYMAVELTAAQLLLHTADITLSGAVWIALTECIVSLWQRGFDWRIVGLPRLLVLMATPLLVNVALEVADFGRLLPGTNAIYAEHVRTGYANDPVRGLAIGVVALFAAFQTARRDQLARELSALREINATLVARAAVGVGSRANPDPEAPIVLSQDGGDLVVAPSSVVFVRAQQNYCEFAVSEAVSNPGSPRLTRLVRMTLSEAIGLLPASDFAQTHRSFVANLARVREVVRDGRRFALLFDEGSRVPVSRGRLDEVRERVRARSGAREAA